MRDLLRHGQSNAAQRQRSIEHALAIYDKWLAFDLLWRLAMRKNTGGVDPESKHRVWRRWAYSG